MPMPEFSPKYDTGRYGSTRLPFNWNWVPIHPNSAAIFDQLKQCQTAPLFSLLIGGSSGAGKTTVAEQLAEQWGRSLMRIFPADILHREVGATKSKLLAVFAAAKKAGAVLLLEDVDLVAPAQPAAAASDVQFERCTIRMLHTCMAEFRGPLIFTTERVDAIHTQVTGRVNLHVELVPLIAAQHHALFKQLCGTDVFEKEPQIETKLAELQLGPGDYVYALNQCELHAQLNNEQAAPLNAEAPIHPRHLLHGLKSRQAIRHSSPD